MYNCEITYERINDKNVNPMPKLFHIASKS